MDKFARPPKFRARNKVHYRFAHWPIWIAVFFLAPGPLIFRLFAHGFSSTVAIWLGVILVGTGLAGLAGQLPGVEPKPYIIHFNEDRPNPLYRRICYTLAWGELIAYAVLNWIGLADAVVTGKWHLQQIYSAGYFPLAGIIWLVGAMGLLPRVKPSTRERRRRTPLLLQRGLDRRTRARLAWIAVGTLAADTAGGRNQVCGLLVRACHPVRAVLTPPAAAHAPHRARVCGASDDRLSLRSTGTKRS